jgi:histidinol dehydrogenase
MAPPAPRPADDHRADREAGAVVYPVISRRSGGLSLGINLFPDRKVCSFDCPYCEVFPFSTELRFSPAALERGLRSAVADADRRGLPARDICFSGNGEPTLSPAFPEALSLAGRLRDELCPAASLVVITNASTLADEPTAALLRGAARPRDAGGLALDLWVKLDAGTAEWYAAIDRSPVPFAALLRGIEAFLSSSPATIQTMLCAVDGAGPSAAETDAWLALAVRLARTGNVRRFHLYGKARPAPEDPRAEALPDAALEERAARLRSALAGAVPSSPVPVEVFP